MRTSRKTPHSRRRYPRRHSITSEHGSEFDFHHKETSNRTANRPIDSQMTSETTTPSIKTAVLLHTPGNPLNFKKGEFLIKHRILRGVMITEPESQDNGVVPGSQRAQKVLVPFESTGCLKHLIDFKKLQLKEEFTNQTFTLMIQRVKIGQCAEIPEDGSKIDFTQSYHCHIVGEDSKVDLNMSELCAKILISSRKSGINELAQLCPRDQNEEGWLNGIKPARREYRWLSPEKLTTLYIPKPVTHLDQAFQPNHWLQGNAVYTSTKSIKFDGQLRPTYVLNTTEGWITVLFENQAIQLKFTQLLHTLLQFTRHDYEIAIWDYHLKTLGGDPKDKAVWITGDYSYRGCLVQQDCMENQIPKEDFRSQFILRMTTPPDFTQKVTTKSTSSQCSDETEQSKSCIVPKLDQTSADSTDLVSNGPPTDRSVTQSLSTSDLEPAKQELPAKPVKVEDFVTRVFQATKPQVPTPRAEPPALLPTPPAASLQTPLPEQVSLLNPMMSQTQLAIIQRQQGLRKPLKLQADPKPHPI